MSTLRAPLPVLLALALVGCGDEAVRDDPTLPPAPRAFRVLGCDLGVRVEFGGDLDPSTVTVQTVLVERVTGTVAYDPAGRAVTFVPSEPFVSGELYSAVLSDELASTAGVRLAQPVRWQFACADRSPPVVIERIPVGDGHSPLVRPSLRFSEPLDEATLTPEHVGIDGVEVDLSWDASQRTLTLSPREPLHPGRSWTVRVSSKVRDRAGNALGAEVSWKFRTRAPTDDWTVKLATPPFATAAPCDTDLELRLSPRLTLDLDVLAQGSPVLVDGVFDLSASWDELEGVLRIGTRTPLRPGGVYPLLATSNLRDANGVAFFDDRAEIAKVQVVSSCDVPTVARVPNAWGTVDCASPLEVHFTVPMEPETTAAALELRDLGAGGFDPAGSPAVPAQITLDETGRLATLTPQEALSDGGLYWLALKPGAIAVDGSSLERSGGWEVAAACSDIP